jgi:hypothetical protein
MWYKRALEEIEEVSDSDRARELQVKIKSLLGTPLADEAWCKAKTDLVCLGAEGSFSSRPLLPLTERWYNRFLIPDCICDIILSLRVYEGMTIMVTFIIGTLYTWWVLCHPN